MQRYYVYEDECRDDLPGFIQICGREEEDVFIHFHDYEDFFRWSDEVPQPVADIVRHFFSSPKEYVLELSFYRRPDELPITLAILEMLDQRAPVLFIDGNELLRPCPPEYEFLDLRLPRQFIEEFEQVIRSRK